jgi:hypothetical protein
MGSDPQQTKESLFTPLFGPSGVAHLRRKLEDEPARPVHFITETGIGYRFVG